MNNVEYNEAISEVLFILQNSEDEVISKIPINIIRFLRANASDTYYPEIDLTINIEKMNLKQKTRAILATLYKNYLCSEEEKITYNEKLKENERIYQEKIKEEYKKEELFVNKAEDLKENNTMLKEYKKDNFFMKIIKKIKALLF